MIEARATTALEHDLRPNPAVLCGAGGAVALISALSLPWPLAIASITLAALMIAGADIDARTYLIPDTVSCGAVLAGILAAAFLDPSAPWPAAGTAIARAVGTALALATVRRCYDFGASARAGNRCDNETAIWCLPVPRPVAGLHAGVLAG